MSSAEPKTTAGQIARALNATQTGPSQWIAHCPAHDDQNPSLSIKNGERNKPLLKCFAGCTYGAVMNAIYPNIGQDLRDTLERKSKANGAARPKQKPDKVHVYRNEMGEPVYTKLRFGNGPGKTFAIGRNGPDGWINNIEGVERVPYNLPALVNAPLVIVVEGEKDADNLAELLRGKAIAATTNEGGANGGSTWPDAWGERWFKDKRVAILPDNDAPGRRHAHAVAAKLDPHVTELRFLELPGLKEKGDVSDWIAAGGTADELRRLISAAPQWNPSMAPEPEPDDPEPEQRPAQFTFTPFAQIKPDLTVRPIIKGLLDSTALSRFYGPPSQGKTLLILDIAMHVAMRSETWFGLKVHGGPVVYVATEGPYSLEKRVEAFRLHHDLGDQDFPFWLVVPADFDMRERRTVDALIEHVRKHVAPDPVLLVIDTQNQAMPGTDEGAEDIGLYTANSKYLRDELNCHVLTVHHSGKDLERGGRGHSSGLGNVDTECVVTEIKGRGVHKMEVEKNRDGSKLCLWFERVVVDLGKDADGDTVTSVVIVQAEEPDSAKASGAGLSGSAKTALAILRELAGATEDGKPGWDKPIPRESWKEACKGRLSATSADADRKAFDRAIKPIVDGGFARQTDDDCYVPA
jgi:hypothetical protein